MPHSARGRRFGRTSVSAACAPDLDATLPARSAHGSGLDTSRRSVGPLCRGDLVIPYTSPPGLRNGLAALMCRVRDEGVAPDTYTRLGRSVTISLFLSHSPVSPALHASVSAPEPCSAPGRFIKSSSCSSPARSGLCLFLHVLLIPSTLEVCHSSCRPGAPSFLGTPWQPNATG